MEPLPSTMLFPGLKVDWTTSQIGFSAAVDAISQRLTMNRIILPGDFNTRHQLIEKFLKEWLTKRQQASMGIWVRDLLQAFSTDLLLHAQKIGIEKMLMDTIDMEGKTILRQRDKHYPLVIVPEKPKRPIKVPVTLEEISGDLETNTKVLPMVEPEMVFTEQ